METLLTASSAKVKATYIYTTYEKRQKLSSSTSKQIRILPDSSLILVVNENENNETKKIMWRRNASHSSRRIRQIISGSSDNDIKVWDLTSKTSQVSHGAQSDVIIDCVKTLKGHADLVWCFLIEPIKKQTLLSASWDNTIKVWNLTNMELVRTLEGHTSIVWCLAFVSQQRYVASGSFDNNIKVWSMENGECVKTLLDHTSWIRLALL